MPRMRIYNGAQDVMSSNATELDCLMGSTWQAEGCRSGSDKKKINDESRQRVVGRLSKAIIREVMRNKPVEIERAFVLPPAMCSWDLLRRHLYTRHSHDFFVCETRGCVVPNNDRQCDYRFSEVQMARKSTVTTQSPASEIIMV